MTKAPWHENEWEDIEGVGPRWNDLRFPATAINPPGVVSDPDVDPNSGVLLFDASSTELIYAIAQMPHSWKEGSTIKPHVHWYKTTSAAGNVAWRMRYKMFPIGEVGDSDWSEADIATNPVVSDNDTALSHALTPFSEIVMSGKQLSDMIIFEIARVGGDTGDTYAADAALLEFDVHYIIDSRGSRQEFTK